MLTEVLENKLHNHPQFLEDLSRRDDAMDEPVVYQSHGHHNDEVSASRLPNRNREGEHYLNPSNFNMNVDWAMNSA